MILGIGSVFGKIGRGVVTGSKVAWKVYNTPYGQVLVTAFAPAKIAMVVGAAVATVGEVREQLDENKKREMAKEMVLMTFPQAADDKKLLNFLIEAQLQKMAGNAEIG